MATEENNYRLRAEIVIWKGNQILVTINGTGKDQYFGLPGGGIDQGETPADAAAREALEEVGVTIVNLVDTGFTGIRESDPEKNYHASKTHLFAAEYNGLDHAMKGTEMDAAHFKWMDIADAFTTLDLQIAKGGGTGDQILRYLSKFL